MKLSVIAMLLCLFVSQYANALMQCCDMSRHNMSSHGGEMSEPMPCHGDGETSMTMAEPSHHLPADDLMSHHSVESPSTDCGCEHCTSSVTDTSLGEKILNTVHYVPLKVQPDVIFKAAAPTLPPPIDSAH